MKKKPQVERRKTERTSRVGLIQADSFWVGRTRNISPSGAQIELQEALPEGARVSIDLASGEKVIEVRARVVYVKPARQSGYLIGLEFEPADEATTKAIEEFVNQNRG